MIRYAGLFCNRWKGRYLSQARAALDQPDTDDACESSSWAERQADYRGVDPLICPFCQQPLTFVGAFWGSWHLLQSVFYLAGKDSTIAPPLLKPG